MPFDKSRQVLLSNTSNIAKAETRDFPFFDPTVYSSLRYSQQVCRLRNSDVRGLSGCQFGHLSSSVNLRYQRIAVKIKKRMYTCYMRFRKVTPEGMICLSVVY